MQFNGYYFLLFITIASTVVNITGKNSTSPLIEVGQQAPNFTLPDETETERSLSDFKGKYVVLYFYPQDETPGCTEQACKIRDSFDDFQKNNVIVLGISYDSPSSHKKFKEHHKLPFILLSDVSKKVAKTYKAYRSLLRWWPLRKTLVINPEGVIIGILPDVDVTTHVKDIMKIIKQDNATKSALSESPNEKKKPKKRESLDRQTSTWEKIKPYLKSLGAIAALFALVGLWRSKKKKRKKLSVGDKAPDFKLRDDNNEERTLKEFEGKYLILYFYPKNNTPGCTKQACGIQDSFEKFRQNNVVVAGISYDSPESHKNFKKENCLQFILLSDTTKEVAIAYGAEGAVANVVPRRITFVINPKGFICGILPKVIIEDHVNDLLKIIEKDRAKK